MSIKIDLEGERVMNGKIELISLPINHNNNV